MFLQRSRFVELLWREAGPKGRKILLHGGLSGLFEALAIVFINGAVAHMAEDGLNFRFFGLFVVSVLLYLYGDRYALSQSLAIIGAIIYDTHLRIVDKVRRSSLIEYERTERTTIYSVLVENSEILVEATRYLADGVSNLFMLAISAVYIASLSFQALLMVLVLDLVGLSLFVMTQDVVSKELRKVRSLKEEFLASVSHLLNGFKEIKVNAAKGDDLFDNYIKSNSIQAKDLKISTEVRSCRNFLMVRAFFMFLIACVVFLLPQLVAMEITTVTSIVAVVLFSIGPLGQILLGIPFFTKAELAVAAIDALEQRLDAYDDMKDTDPDSRLAKKTDFEEIQIKDVTFSYTQNDSGHAFNLGPLNLSIRRGELIFIAGGNGSGKSTLLKLLAGLYYPSRGAAYVDDIMVKPSNYAHYRRMFSAIFSDFHTFDRLYGIDHLDRAFLQDMLDRMDLSRRTTYMDGKFTDINLSTGQKKRLALVACAMENKPVLLFDEVAADFDPQFRTYFYEVYLKELKARGKTIVAISHDDRYFHLADRLIKMDYGTFIGPDCARDQG